MLEFVPSMRSSLTVRTLPVCSDLKASIGMLRMMYLSSWLVRLLGWMMLMRCLVLGLTNARLRALSKNRLPMLSSRVSSRLELILTTCRGWVRTITSVTNMVLVRAN